MSEAVTIWKTAALKKALEGRVKTLSRKLAKAKKNHRSKALAEARREKSRAVAAARRRIARLDREIRVLQSRPVKARGFYSEIPSVIKSVARELLTVSGHTKDTIEVSSNYVSRFLAAGHYE
jgi:hypothetical protein